MSMKAAHVVASMPDLPHKGHLPACAPADRKTASASNTACDLMLVRSVPPRAAGRLPGAAPKGATAEHQRGIIQNVGCCTAFPGDITAWARAKGSPRDLMRERKRDYAGACRLNPSQPRPGIGRRDRIGPLSPILRACQGKDTRFSHIGWRRTDIPDT